MIRLFNCLWPSPICCIKKHSADGLEDQFSPATADDTESPLLLPHSTHNSSNVLTLSNGTEACQPPSSTEHDDEKMSSPLPSPPLAVTNPCLYNQMSKELIKEEQSPRSFLQRGAFDNLITADNIEAELRRTDCITKTQSDTEVRNLVNYIFSRARRCFATLVFIKKVPEIKTFHQNSLTDQQLPVAFEIIEDKCVPRVLNEACSHLDAELLSACFQHKWDLQDCEAFEEKQWLFLAPVFTEEDWQHDFHDKCPLPFLDPGNQVARQTLFSDVRQWLIHRDHITGFGRQLDDLHQVVAVKELKLVSDNGNLSSPDPGLEAITLERTQKLKHHHLIKAIAVYKKRGKHHFIFPWAQYGNLREYWVEWQGLTKAHWALEQINGLCDALREFHAQNWRHGDLKPENILCFADGEAEGCVMVIGDVGLAKAHTVVTQHRRGITGTMTGTWMYGPPEEKGQPRSRLYDIWSMGAIILEMIICLLYGHSEVSRLHGNIQKFYMDQTIGNTTAPQVHPEVQRWIKHIYQDPRCGNCEKPTAIFRLLKLVQGRLLIVKIPQRTEMTDVPEHPTQLDTPQLTVQAPEVMQQDVETPKIVVGTEDRQPRADAKELYDEVHSILNATRATDSKQLPLFLSDNSNRTFGGPLALRKTVYGNTLGVPGQPSLGPQALEVNSQVNSQDFPLDDFWEYIPDDDARSVFTTENNFAALLGENQLPAKFCRRCKDIDLWDPELSFADDLPGVLHKSQFCGLCKLLSQCLPKHVGNTESFQLSVTDSSLTLRGHGHPKVLSLCFIPETSGSKGYHSDAAIRLGLPTLPPSKSQMHFKLLREWIRACDATHKCHTRVDKFLPTRVLDVGHLQDTESIRLCSVGQNITTLDRYIALSHRWGDPKQHRQFCTTLSNISSFHESIDYDQLPKTFQDAIVVTRNLGVRYLWIDSLCIIQDDAADWEKESKRMEGVFSAAYCTIAATCASGSADGFLKNRPARDYVTKQIDKYPLVYILPAIDNFQVDVEDSELNQRGWVLQERVLSRRTIYYTQKQCYWECGEGIRCETLKKTQNLKASFLGDAHFPESAEKFYKGGRIRVYEVLFERYSKLVFSLITDRPVAISGLEERLRKSFKTAGRYGIFECYFHRGLLWQRSGDSLKRIKSLRDPGVPSWSWMGYDGSIKYMDVPARQAEWNTEVQSPFTSEQYNPSGEHVGTTSVSETMQLKAVARDFTRNKSQNLVFDDLSRHYNKDLRCIVIGKEKQTPGPISTPQRYYVLIIVEIDRVVDGGIYERVAVGCIEGRYISLEGPGDRAMIR